MNKHILRIKEYIREFKCMGTYGLVELELTELQKQLESTEVVKNNAVSRSVSHSSLQNLKTYWVKYDNEWQPTKAHYPYNDRVLYFKFLNGMIVGCDQIPEEHIKPLCYCG